MRVNGKEMRLSSSVTLSEVLSEQGFSDSRIAVELNGRIVPRAKYAETMVCDSDTLEVVSMVGGG